MVQVKTPHILTGGHQCFKVKSMFLRICVATHNTAQYHNQ